MLRQACAGLVWSKQMYPYDVSRWLDGDPGQPAPPAARLDRAQRGLAAPRLLRRAGHARPVGVPLVRGLGPGFHAMPWAHLDPAFAKYQLLVLLREWFQHPNGALPAYEWNFDDVNPPVHALAALRVFVIDGSRDLEFLERVFQKLLLNFTWWVNRQDPDGNNLFGGGFLGLDNISPVDRSHLPPGVRLEQADGTAWMAYYSLVDAPDRDRARGAERRLRGHGGQVPRAVRADHARARPPGLYDAEDGVLLRPHHGRRAGSPRRSGCRRSWA